MGLQAIDLQAFGQCRQRGVALFVVVYQEHSRNGLVQLAQRGFDVGGQVINHDHGGSAGGQALQVRRSPGFSAGWAKHR